MKVGIVGDSRTCEGMTRRMSSAGIEVHHYRNNMKSLVEETKKKYIYGIKSGETHESVESGVFMVAATPETEERYLDELIPLLDEGDIIIDMCGGSVSTCKEFEMYCSKLGIAYIFSGVYGPKVAIDSCFKIFNSLSPVSNHDIH